MSELIQILQVYIGAKGTLDAPLTELQWENAFREAERQSLVGVFNKVIQLLPMALAPPLKIRLQCGIMAQVIAERNLEMNKHCGEITDMFLKMGYASCVLKGQGMADLYPFPLSRTCGDIDLWVMGTPKNTLAALRNKWKTGQIFYHHTSIQPFDDKTEVEVHFRPSWLNDPFANKILQDYFDVQSSRQFNREIDKLGFAVPDAGFNCVFCAVHIYRHLLYEGVGLRQIMDYYYVLCSSTAEDRAMASEVLASLKLTRFVHALMFVLQEWFQLDPSLMIMLPDRKYGAFLMDEIRLSGNFGHYDGHNKMKAGDTLPRRALKRMLRLRRYVSIAPLEVLWAPIFKVWQYLWRFFFVKLSI